jgi:hypothetical protein
VRLRGFSRVGGVLIGREPEGNATLDIRDIQWRLQGAGLTLTLVDDKRREISIGPVRATVANLALGYAADGRPLTVTMVTADPLRELRILLHPILVDTPVGCRAIEIDRFVDEATSKSSLRSNATALVEIQRSLYAVARAALIRAVFSGDDAAALIRRDNDAAALAETLASADAPPDFQSFKEVFGLAMKYPNYLFASRHSPLEVKKGYFHPRVVGLLKTCAKPNGTYSELKDCLSLQAGVQAIQRSELTAKKNLNWTAPTPTWQLWSGVREASYRLDPQFKFAGAGSAPALPDPFDFIIQLAFTSPPYAAREKVWFEDEEAEDVDDPTPWLFPDGDTLAGDLKITTSVTDLIKRDPTHQEVFTAMREFVWLQRLFRAGLSGGLGADFPVERLSQLARVTAGQVVPQRTLRWNVRTPPELTFLTELSSDVPGYPPTFKQRAEACMRRAGVVSTSGPASVESIIAKLRSLSDDDWDRDCRFADNSMPDKIVKLSSQVSDTRRLRGALGVREDEQLIAAGAQCKPL